MERSDFSRLMERYLKDEVSEQERIKIEAWLEVRKTDGGDLEFSREDQENLFRKITSNMNNLDEIIALRPEIEKKTSSHRWLLGIAASLLVVSLVSLVLWTVFKQNNNKLEAVSKEGVEKVILNDGTLVWLRGKSKLSYYEKSNGFRYGKLEGEALFEVAKDAAHPFVLRCADIEIKVLGTSFNVKTANTLLELKVLTGKVHVLSEKNKQSIDVEPNEQVIYNGDGEIKKSSIDKEALPALTANTEYRMSFRNTSMRDVLKKFEDKFNVSIQRTNEEIGNCRITADFTDHSLESSLQMISETLSIAYSKEGNTITLTGNGCK
jgi:ferric-dicitrate binding protein FerR (iron transport regulator)